MQFVGIVSCRWMRCPLSLMYEFILGTKGWSCRSASCETFSVGPPHPLTIGLTAMGFL